ncbi:flocculation protein FLO11 [Drosophila obscura]|uniref:flocculation protein FLO11 n=1 Tax=Drosophila obscura TaxID=7282 RepID=UPI001BB1FEE2|nr:flocculation protein FLO11 [Drosophila obscura]
MITQSLGWILWLVAIGGCHLISGQQLQGPPPRPRGRIRISDMQAQIPGPDPMLRSWPSLAGSVPVSSTVHTHIPLLREESARPATPRQEASVVYGNWKPEHPENPYEADAEQQPKERVYGRLEAMLMGMPAEGTDTKPSRSIEEQLVPIAPGDYQGPELARPASFERSPEKHGRRRITSQQSPHQFEVVKMNATDPLLRAMAKQINESVETTTGEGRRPSQSTTDDNWMPLPYPYPYDTTVPAPSATSSSSSSLPQSSVVHSPAPTQATRSTTVSLNWPTDFIDSSANSANSANSASTEPERVDANLGMSIDRRDDSVGDSLDDYKYYEDSLNSAQMHSELSVPETLVPQRPLNITRVGIPFEERNAAEEPTICVPLTVTETSLASDSATPLVLEVERVYCFPLPKVEVRTGSGSVIRQQVEQITRSSLGEIPEMEMEPTEQPMPTDVTAGAASQSTRSMTLLFLLLLHIGYRSRPRIWI